MIQSVSHKKTLTGKLFIILFFFGLFCIQYSRLILVKGILYSNDIRLGIFPWRVVTFGKIFHHLPAKWTDYIFCGYPLGSDFVTAMLYPMNLIFFGLFPTYESGFDYYILFHLVISVIGMILYSRLLGTSDKSSVISALTFTFGGFMVSRLCQPTVFDMVCWLPWVLYYLDLSYRRKNWMYTLLAGIIQGIIILGGHPNISVYLFAFTTIYALFLGIVAPYSESGKRDNAYSLKQFSFFLFVSLGIGALFIFPARELIMQSYRAEKFSFERMTEDSFTWSCLIRVVTPFVLGGPYDYHRTDTSFVESMFYVGSLPLAFFIINLLFYKKNKYETFYLWVIFLSTIVAFGKYTPAYLLLGYFPFIQHMHAPGRAILVAAFGVPVLTGLGLDKLLEKGGFPLGKSIKQYGKEFYYILILLMGITFFLFFISLPGIDYITRWTNLVTHIYLTDTLIRLVLWCLSISLCLFWLEKKISKSFFYMSILLITSIELLTMGAILNRDLIRAEDVDLIRTPPDTAKFLDSEKYNYRIYTYSERNMLSREDIFPTIHTLYRGLSMLYGFNNFHSHTPTSFSRYYELMGLPEEPWIQVPSSQRKDELYRKIPILQMMNVKYVLSQETLDFPDLKLVFTGAANIYQLSNPFPKCFFVDQWKIANDKSQALSFMQSTESNFHKMAVLEEPLTEIPMDSSQYKPADIRFNRINTAHSIIQCQIYKPGLIVFTDAFFPGWNAFLDGKPVKIYRANYIVRAIPVSTGTHSIVFIYDPLSYKIGFWTFIGTIVGILIAFISHFLRIRKP